MAPVSPIILDVTRTLSRVDGRHATGIDRVERAYIEHLGALDREVMFLSRLGRGIALLDRDGLAEILRQIRGDAPRQAPDLRARLAVTRDPDRAWIDSVLRQHRLTIGGRAAMPQKPFHYINVGHTHREVLARMRALGAAEITVLIHDLIPLDRPDLQTPQSVRRFSTFFAAVAEHATRVIANSHVTADRLRHWLGPAGQRIKIVVAHLGIDPPDPVAAHYSNRPYCLQLGTLEPRKNVGFTLDIWDKLAGAGPDLCLIGRRGWMIDAVAARLDDPSTRPARVQEFADLDDIAVQSRLKGAAAMLFPSLIEGFGLPLLEALQHGVPVIAADLPVFRELAGEHALYLPTDNVNTWATCVNEVAAKFAKDQHNRGKPPGLIIPRWQDHFASIEPLLVIP